LTIVRATRAEQLAVADFVVKNFLTSRDRDD
jgi:hypothetical protein